MKKKLAILISIAIILSLTMQTFALKTKPTPTKIPKETKLVFMFFGDEPIGMDKVLAEYDKRTKNTLNIKLEMIFTPFGEFKNKVKLKLAAGEEVDAVFDAPWWGMEDMINMGNYKKLDQYFNNAKYPGLKKAFSTQFITNNKFRGNVYGIPIGQGYKTINGFFIRKDLRVKFGMDKISNIDELEEYFDNVKQTYPTMIPLADDGAALRWAYGFSDENESYYAKANRYSVLTGTGMYSSVKLSSDKKKIIKVEYPADKPKPTLGEPYDVVKISTRWKKEGYFEKDLLTQQNALGLFKAGKAAAVAHEITRFPSLSTELAAAVKGAGLEFFVASDSQRAFAPKAIRTDFKVFNFACIPVSSKNADSVMRFYDWLFADKANHDLFELGIQGKNWIAVGTSKYKTVAGSKYSFPGYEMTWNSTMVRNLDGMDPEAYKIMDYMMKDSSYDTTPFGSFSFNSEAVQNQIIKVTDIFAQISQIYASGIYGDEAHQKAYELNQKAKQLGLDDIRKEAMKQLSEYVKTIK